MLQSLPTMNNTAQFEKSAGLNILLNRLVLILLSIGLNLLIFIMIQRLVSHDSTINHKLTDLSLVEFIRIRQKPIAPQPKPDETPLPPKPLPPPQVIQKTINKPISIAIDIPVPNLTLPLFLSGKPYVGDAMRPNLKKSASPVIDINVVPTLKIEPVYPPRALRSRTEGLVIVEFTIDVNGQVKEPVIVTATPAKIFDKAVLTAIVKWQFNPELVDGQAVAKRARQTIRFRLQR